MSRRDDCVHSHPWLIPNASGALREAGGGLLSSWGAPIGLFGSLARGPRPPAEGSGETTVPTATPSYYPMPPESVVWLRQKKKARTKIRLEPRSTDLKATVQPLDYGKTDIRAVELILSYLTPFGHLILGPPLSLGRLMPRGSQKLSPRSNYYTTDL